MQLDANGCGDISHYVQGCAFEFCDTGLYANNCYVTLDGVTQCGVATPLYTPSSGCTTFSGTIDPGTGCSSDADGNGIPDNWEFQYFGTVHINPDADPDADGVTNLNEYRQGRNPTVAGTTSDANNQIRLQAYTPLK